MTSRVAFVHRANACFASQRLRSASGAGNIRASRRRRNRRVTIDMTNHPHIAALSAPNVRVRGAGMGNAAVVDRQSATCAAISGGRATT